MRKKICSILAGLAAGAVNGLLGAGGGMVLVPILSAGSTLEEREIFSSKGDAEASSITDVKPTFAARMT